MHVLIATDGSEQSLEATRFLRKMADQSTVEKVTVIAVVRPLAAVPFVTDIGAQRSTERGQEWQDYSFRQAAESATSTIAAELTDWSPEVSTMVVSGSPASQIVAVAKEIGANLILVASRSSRVTDTVLMGSVAHRVMTYAPCPVLVHRPTPAR